MTVHQFIYSVFDMLYNFLFNVLAIPNSPGVYFGWVIISIFAMSITINALLNIPKAIASKGGTNG